MAPAFTSSTQTSLSSRPAQSTQKNSCLTKQNKKLKIEGAWKKQTLSKDAMLNSFFSRLTSICGVAKQSQSLVTLGKYFPAIVLTVTFWVCSHIRFAKIREKPPELSFVNAEQTAAPVRVEMLNGKNKMFKITPILRSELPPSSSSNVEPHFSLSPSLYSIQTGIFHFRQKNTRTASEPKLTVGCRHQPVPTRIDSNVIPSGQPFLTAWLKPHYLRECVFTPLLPVSFPQDVNRKRGSPALATAAPSRTQDGSTT